MTDETDRLVRELKDRQDIHDCLVRYCRGMYRFDRDLLRSAYHPDALDDHGDYVGGVEGFIDFYFDYHARNQVRTVHDLGNHTCELDGDTAHTETYWTFSAINREGPRFMSGTGRYIDRFERRDGKWAIAARICVLAANSWATGADDELDGNFVPTARDRNDPSYMRPLVIDPRRLAQGHG